jgi:hypothetical protein
MERLLKRVVVALGAPDDESPLFYRDIGLALPFILAVFVALSLAIDVRFGIAFVVCVGVALVCMRFATKRLALVGSVFIVAAVRFAIACLTEFRVTTLVAGVTCAVVGLWIAQRHTGEYPDAG